MKYQTDDLRIIEMKEVSSPTQVLTEFPVTEDSSSCVFHAREQIQQRYG